MDLIKFCSKSNSAKIKYSLKLITNIISNIVKSGFFFCLKSFYAMHSFNVLFFYDYNDKTNKNF